MADVQIIVGQLTEPQRAAILRAQSNWAYTGQKGNSAEFWLRGSGILERRWDTRARRHQYRLTPFGAKVRAFLGQGDAQ